MRRAAILALLGTVCASQDGFAQTSLVDFGTGVFVPFAGPAAFAQSGPANNVLGLVQTGTAPTAVVNQTGFYNRAAIIEVGTVSTNASLTQTGDFSHGLIVQVSPDNTAAVVRNGSQGTAIVSQSDTSRIAGLSPAGLSLLASNFLYAPENAAALPRLAQETNHGLARSVFNRLDSLGVRQCAVPDGPAPAPPSAATERCALALFASGHVETGDRRGGLGASGLTHTTGRVTVGAEYAVAPGFVIGPLLDLSRSRADLDRGSGRVDLGSIHVGAFASYTQDGFFAHAIGAYGFDSYRLTRPGFTDPVAAAPGGDSVVAAGKLGYLFDFGSVRIGPVGALSYARGAVDAFVETGDPLLTQQSAAQSRADLVGGGGLRIRFQVPFGAGFVSPFLDLMAEHDRPLDRARTLRTAFSFAPDQTLLTPVRAVDETYGRVVGGVSVQLTDLVQLGLAAEGTFARPTGDAFAFTGTFRLAF